MTAENKRLVRRLTEAWNERDREGMAAVYAEEVRMGETGETRDRETLLDGEWEYFEAFPDATAETEHLVAEDDLVVVRWTVSATHEGPFRGVAPTGESVEYEEWVIYRVAGDAIVEMWAIADALEVFEAIGAVDPPAE